jgi:hypothetical protein
MTYRNSKERTLGQKTTFRRNGPCLNHLSLLEQVELAGGVFVPKIKIEPRGPATGRELFIEEEGVLKWKWNKKEPGEHLHLSGIQIPTEFFTWFFFTGEFPLKVATSLGGGNYMNHFPALQGFTQLGSQLDCCNGDFSDRVLVFGTNGHVESPALFEAGPLSHFYRHGTWPLGVKYLDGNSANILEENLEFRFGDGPPALPEPEEAPCPRYWPGQCFLGVTEPSGKAANIPSLTSAKTRLQALLGRQD